MVRPTFHRVISCAESVHPCSRCARHRTPTTPASHHLLADTATAVDQECLAKACGDLSEALKTRFPTASTDTITRIIKTASTAIASDPPGPLYFSNNALASVEPKKKPYIVPETEVPTRNFGENVVVKSQPRIPRMSRSARRGNPSTAQARVP